MTVQPTLSDLLRIVDAQEASERRQAPGTRIAQVTQQQNLPVNYTIGLLADALADLCTTIEAHGQNIQSDVFASAASARGLLSALVQE